MPGFDRTGPFGKGAITGRGLGPCGRDLARGRGLNRFAFVGPRIASLNETEQKNILKEEVNALEAELKQLKEALKNLSK